MQPSGPGRFEQGKPCKAGGSGLAAEAATCHDGIDPLRRDGQVERREMGEAMSAVADQVLVRCVWRRAVISRYHNDGY